MIKIQTTHTGRPKKNVEQIKMKKSQFANLLRVIYGFYVSMISYWLERLKRFLEYINFPRGLDTIRKHEF